MLSLPQESSIDINLLEQMQEENIVTSYKLFWFRGIFKEIINGNKEITFRSIVCRMIAEARYPLIEYDLNFGAIDMLYDLCMLIHRKYKIDSNISEHKLLEFVKYLNAKEVERGIRNLYNMVPYRLLAPFLLGNFKAFPVFYVSS